MADGVPIACTWKLPAKVATNVVLFALVNVGADGGSGVGATVTPWKTVLATAVAIGVSVERLVPLPVIRAPNPLESVIFSSLPPWVAAPNVPVVTYRVTVLPLTVPVMPTASLRPVSPGSLPCGTQGSALLVREYLTTPPSLLAAYRVSGSAVPAPTLVKKYWYGPNPLSSVDEMPGRFVIVWPEVVGRPVPTVAIRSPLDAADA